MHSNDKIRCLIIDDEPPAIEILRQHISGVQALEFTGSCHNAVEAISFLKENPVDLLFLDIHMPKLDGFDVLELLGKSAPAIVFVTAHDDYAIRAFDQNALDYLLKPVSAERLSKTVERITAKSSQPELD